MCQKVETPCDFNRVSP